MELRSYDNFVRYAKEYGFPLKCLDRWLIAVVWRPEFAKPLPHYGMFPKDR